MVTVFEFAWFRQMHTQRHICRAWSPKAENTGKFPKCKAAFPSNNRSLTSDGLCFHKMILLPQFHLSHFVLILKNATLTVHTRRHKNPWINIDEDKLCINVKSSLSPGVICKSQPAIMSVFPRDSEFDCSKNSQRLLLYLLPMQALFIYICIYFCNLTFCYFTFA